MSIRNINSLTSNTSSEEVNLNSQQNSNETRIGIIEAAVDRAFALLGIHSGNGQQPQPSSSQSSIVPQYSHTEFPSNSSQSVSFAESTEEQQLLNELNEIRNAFRHPSYPMMQLGLVEQVFYIFHVLGEGHPVRNNFWLSVAQDVPRALRAEFFYSGIDSRICICIREAFGTAVQAPLGTPAEIGELVNLINARDPQPTSLGEIRFISGHEPDGMVPREEGGEPGATAASIRDDSLGIWDVRNSSALISNLNDFFGIFNGFEQTLQGNDGVVADAISLLNTSLPHSTSTSTTDLSASLQAFRDAVPDDVLKSFDVESLKEESSLITLWLHKLKTGKEFSDPQMRPLLSTRVLSILLFATKNPEYLEKLKSILVEATGSCVDNASLGVNDLEIEKKIRESSDSSLGYVIKLLKGSFKINCLREFGARIVADRYNNQHIDDVEVQLGLQVKLKDVLDLPVDVQDMNYFSHSTLTEQDLSNAKNAVKASLANIDLLADYFVAQKTWTDRIEKEFGQEKGVLLVALEKEMDDLYSRAADMLSGDYKNQAEAIAAKANKISAEWLKSKTIELLKQSV
jgi:hypothetical protein